MKYVKIAHEMDASEIILGCWRIADMEHSDVSRLIRTAMDLGINVFDHADIYGDGVCEEKFAKAAAFTPEERSRVIIQSKCGICKGYYDFSKEHILRSVEGSLKRLRTEYLDVLLLHRPDALMEPGEVAEAFARLHASGKVRCFGVSNFNSLKIELLQKYLPHKIAVNQMQLSIANAGMLDADIHANLKDDWSCMRDASVMDYCRLHEITLQAWSPLQYGFLKTVFLDDQNYPELNQKLRELSEKYNVTPAAIAIAWILRLPAKIQPVLGTTKPDRLAEICRASDISLTRPEWYALYLSAGNYLP